MADNPHVFLTKEQSDMINEQVLDMQRHAVWESLVRADPNWPYRCICRACNQETL